MTVIRKDVFVEFPRNNTKVSGRYIIESRYNGKFRNWTSTLLDLNGNQIGNSQSALDMETSIKYIEWDFEIK